jgi:hypothetical protein
MIVLNVIFCIFISLLKNNFSYSIITEMITKSAQKKLYYGRIRNHQASEAKNYC